MAVEIERKFLIKGRPWESEPGKRQRLQQGYLNHDKQRTTRVRIAGNQAFLTIKGANQGAMRLEFEYPIPLDDARQLLALCEGSVIDKYRHCLHYAGMTWEIDEFLGDNAGLVVAEIELNNEQQRFARPDWLSTEVTSDPRYYNSNLSRAPFKKWG